MPSLWTTGRCCRQRSQPPRSHGCAPAAVAGALGRAGQLLVRWHWWAGSGAPAGPAPVVERGPAVVVVGTLPLPDAHGEQLLAKVVLEVDAAARACRAALNQQPGPINSTGSPGPACRLMWRYSAWGPPLLGADGRGCLLGGCSMLRVQGGARAARRGQSQPHHAVGGVHFRDMDVRRHCVANQASSPPWRAISRGRLARWKASCSALLPPPPCTRMSGILAEVQTVAAVITRRA